VAGNNLGEQILVYQTNASNNKPAVAVNNSGTGAGMNVVSGSGPGIVASSTTNYGVKGTTNTATGFAGVIGENTGTAGSGVIGRSDAANTQGVYGTSASGIGVRAVSNTYRAVQGTSGSGTGVHGSSTSGTGVYASSSSGLALETVGNIKISGGNTNPSDGAVLTSDAQGNATWKKQDKVAFRVAGVADALGTTNAIIASTIFAPVRQKVEYKAIGYDFGNNFTMYNGSTTDASSTFKVPVTGLYHFDASVLYVWATTFDYTEIEVSIMLRRNGSVMELLTNGSYINHVDNTQAAVSGDVTLLAGDEIFVATRQYNFLSLPSLLKDNFTQNFFSGHLVFAF
jgi:hypothetical protein